MYLLLIFKIIHVKVWHIRAGIRRDSCNALVLWVSDILEVPVVMETVVLTRAIYSGGHIITMVMVNFFCQV